MKPTIYWPDKYVENKRNVTDALKVIKPGKRVFIGSSCGEPQHLVRGLSELSNYFKDIEIIRLLTLETTPLTLIANKTHNQSINIRSFYLGSAKPKGIARNQRFITPINMSAIPRLFKSRLLPIHVALIQVSPPDDFGWMSLGVSVDITLAAAQSADACGVSYRQTLGRFTLEPGYFGVFGDSLRFQEATTGINHPLGVTMLLCGCQFEGGVEIRHSHQRFDAVPRHERQELIAGILAVRRQSMGNLPSLL